MKRTSPHRSLASLILGACLAAPAAGSPVAPAQADAPADAPVEVEAAPRAAPAAAELRAVSALVRGARNGGDACATVAGELTALGGALVPSALELLTRCSVPAVAEDDDVQILNRYQRQALLEGLGGLPRETVVAALDAWRAEEPSVAERVTEIGVRGAVGGADDLTPVLELAWRKTDQGLDRRLEDALEEATTSLVLRDPRTLERLRERHATLPDMLRPTLVLAVGAAGDARGVEFLTQVAHWHPELIGAVAGQVVALGPAPSADVNRELCGVMIEHLAQDDPSARSSIALALGSLGVPESVPELIRLLESDLLGVRLNANAALRELTGLAFPAAPALWSTWYRSEVDWYRKEAPGLWRDLESRQPGRAQAALRALAQRRLHRHEIAEHVARLIVTASPMPADVRVQACATLVELESPHGLAALVSGLQDRDEAVREAAWKALVRLTGSELPPESEAWLALVED